jgi:hypothetical protein
MLPVLAAEQVRTDVFRPNVEPRPFLGYFDRPAGLKVD